MSAIAQPQRVALDELVTYTVSVINSSRDLLRDVRLSSVLPANLAVVPGSTEFLYDSSNGALTWDISELAPDAPLRATIQFQVTDAPVGTVITNTLIATGRDLDGSPRVDTVLTVVPPQNEHIALNPVTGAWLRALDGRVEIIVPPDAVTGAAAFAYRPLGVDGSRPQHLPFGFNFGAADESTPAEQFLKPVTLIAPIPLLRDLSATAEKLTFYRRDALNNEWGPLATRVDYINNILIASTDEPGDFALGLTPAAANSTTWEFDPGSRIKGAQPSLFSATIKYDYPFDVPPGRGGLTPAVGLTYSSARHQRESGHYSFVGHGWDILGENYMAKADPSNPAGSKLTLSLNGATYTVSTSPFFVQENPHIQILEYLRPSASFPYYQFKVRTPDGTTYIFKGYVGVSSANPLPPVGKPPAVYRWNDSTCNPSGDTGYPDWVRLPLVEVIAPSEDPNNANRIQYTWVGAASNLAGRHNTDDQKPDDRGCNFIRTIRLNQVHYNFVNGAPQNEIKFNYDYNAAQIDLRWDRPDYYTYQGMHLFAIYKLMSVNVNVKNAAGEWRTVRSYETTYHPQCTDQYCDASSDPEGGTLLLLKEVKEVYSQGNPLVTSFSYDQAIKLDTKCGFGYMTTVSGPYGGQAQFTAAPAGDNTCDTPHPHVLTSQTVKDLVTNQQWTWNYYATSWRSEAHGYNQVNVLAPSLGDGNRRLEIHSFHTMTWFYGDSKETDTLAGREHNTTICMPYAQTADSTCATNLREVIRHWTFTSADLPLDSSYTSLPSEQQPRFVYQATETTKVEGQPFKDEIYTYAIGPQQYKHESGTWQAKQLGNVTEIRESQAINGYWPTNPNRTSYNWYYADANYWILNKPARQELHASCAGCSGDKLMNQTNYFYDSYTFGSPPLVGRLRQKETGVPADSIWQRTRYDYWPNVGSLWKESIETSSNVYRMVSETYYDSHFRAYPVCVKNNLEHKTITRYYGVPGSSDSGCVTNEGSEVWGAGTPPPLNAGAFFGLVQDETDANNATVSAEWDAQGRISKIIQPGDSPTPTVRFAYTAYSGANQPFWVKKEARDNAPGVATTYLESRTFYDGLGQVIQTQSEALDGSKTTVVDTKYGAEGQVIQQNAPYFNTGAPGGYVVPDWTKPATKTKYDALGRVATVTGPDNVQTRTYYRYQSSDNNLLTAVIDGMNHQVITETDAWGQLIKSKQYSNVYTGAPGWTDVPYAQSRYVYDAENRLTDVYGADDARTQITYDGLGRKTQMVDPDMGTWSYAYDRVSNLTRQTDARNQTICFYYDSLNRLTGKHYRTDTTCPTSGATLNVTYSYDEATSANGVGRRTSMSSGGNSATWQYDGRGRVTSETRTVSGSPYATSYTYDSIDRIATMTYPANAQSNTREVVQYGYNAGSQPLYAQSNTYSNYKYVEAIDYTPLGGLRELTYGNTVKERRGYHGLTGNWDGRPSQGTQNYGRLWRIRSYHTVTNLTLFDMAWGYDAVGNVANDKDGARSGSSWPTTYTYEDPFDAKSTSFTWSSQQTVVSDGATNKVIRSAGTGSNNNANFYRNATFGASKGFELRFKVDANNTLAQFALETPDGSKRFGVQVDASGTLQAQYNDGSGTFRYPADLAKPITLNTWYVLRMVIDDTRGFYLEVYPQADTTKRASFTQWMPAGLTWRFHHWIYRGNAYIDDYREFNTGSMTWTPNERMVYGYDALDRLTSVARSASADGYSQTYSYAPNGNLTNKSDVGAYTYPAATSPRPHAAQAAGANYSYTYDDNGNVLTRVENGTTYTHSYDEENRLKTVTVSGVTTTYTYDGDGRRVTKAVSNGATTVYIGNYYEKNLSTGQVDVYVYVGGQRVARRQTTGSSNVVYFFTGDHLGSTSLTLNSSGGEVGRQRYYAYGAPRNVSGALNTDYRFTGQREETNLGSLYDYGARFYSPALGRFLSPDTIVPQPGNPQSLNRYMYVRGNPLKLIDPSGRTECAAGDDACWKAEWEWKNRWYQAHGYYWNGDSWGGTRNGISYVRAAMFRDESILRDTMAELGIQFSNLDAAWAFSEMSLIAQGIVALANKMGGFAQLGKRLPYGAFLMRAQHALFYYFDPSIDPYGHSIPGTNLLVFADELFAQDSRFVRGFAVHEIAHVIDYFNPFSNGTYIHQVVPMGTHLSDYAVQNNLHLEYWAEMVAVWVYGKSYQDTVPGLIAPNEPLTADQAGWITHVLGWGW